MPSELHSGARLQLKARSSGRCVLGTATVFFFLFLFSRFLCFFNCLNVIFFLIMPFPPLCSFLRAMAAGKVALAPEDDVHSHLILLRRPRSSSVQFCSAVAPTQFLRFHHGKLDCTWCMVWFWRMFLFF